MKKLFVFILAFALLACAQENHGPVQKIIPVKNGDAGQIFQTVRDVLAGTAINVKIYQNSIVLNGSPEMVAAAEQLVKNLESASPRERDVEINGYIILASVQAGDGTGTLLGELEPVLKQFRTLLNYKSFRLLDTIVLRTRENSQANSVGLLTLPMATGTPIRFHIDKAIVTDDTIHIKRLELNASGAATWAPGQIQNRDVSISTDVDVKAGQKVAIGKASVAGNGDALILVISAKVVD